MRTSDRLAEALVEAGAPERMVAMAREGRYDDYRSPLPFPLMELVADARRYEVAGIAQRAMDGEFDGTKEESEEWAASPEGQAAFRDVLGGAS